MKNTGEFLITIDAEGKPFGRLASDVAIKLQGKQSTAFRRNALTDFRVRVVRLRRVKFTGKKIAQKTLFRHTGYIGHLKEEKLAELWERKPEDVFRKAVAGMLPDNKLRRRMLKRLEIEV